MHEQITEFFRERIGQFTLKKEATESQRDEFEAAVAHLTKALG